MNGPGMVLFALLLSLPRGAEPKIAIFVTTPASASGFVEVSKDVLDSVTDIKKRVQSKKKELLLVDSAADADVVLRVLERRVVTETYGERVTIDTLRSGTGTTTRATAGPATAWAAYVLTEMEAGSYRKRIPGVSANRAVPWGDCADMIVSELRSWVGANRDRLQSLRRSK